MPDDRSCPCCDGHSDLRQTGPGLLTCKRLHKFQLLPRLDANGNPTEEHDLVVISSADKCCNIGTRFPW